MVTRLAHNQEIAGSNPASATRFWGTINKKQEIEEVQSAIDIAETAADNRKMTKTDHALRNWILKMVVGTLAFICMSVMLVLLYAFFDTSIDNDAIFEVIGPAFNMVVGAFVGTLIIALRAVTTQPLSDK